VKSEELRVKNEEGKRKGDILRNQIDETNQINQINQTNEINPTNEINQINETNQTDEIDETNQTNQLNPENRGEWGVSDDCGRQEAPGRDRADDRGLR
jgi:hypothetical protein